MVKISEQGPQLNDLQVASIARELGATLSNEYKIFLLENNGGRPEPDIIDIQGLPGSPTNVQTFFGIGRKYESSELLWWIQLIKERFPTLHVLPIACDSGGSLFCLKVKNGVASNVVFCDLDTPLGILYEVASGFDDFLKMLREWED